MNQTPNDPNQYDDNSRPPINPQAASHMPPPPPPAYAPVNYGASKQTQTSMVMKILTGLLSMIVLTSIVMNFYFGAFYIAAIVEHGPDETTYQGKDEDKRIVILPIQGVINAKTSVFVRQAIQKLEKDEIKPLALILRIESPGGGVSASDQIWHRLKEYKKRSGIPIVASYGAVAASGGYYISALSDRIFVEPTTITGSIGVIAQAFTVERLLDKVGVTPEVLASTDSTKKDTLSPFRAWGTKDRDELRNILDQAYDRFVSIVDEGRTNLSLAQVKALATGAPYTAKEALENGLADEQGYLDAAILYAKKLAKLSDDSDPKVTVLSPSKPFSLMGIMGHSFVGGLTEFNAQSIRTMTNELATPQLQYSMH